MGSCFKDHDVTSIAVKTKLDLDHLFERYRVFCIRIYKRKGKKDPRPSQQSPRVAQGMARDMCMRYSVPPRGCSSSDATRAYSRAHSP